MQQLIESDVTTVERAIAMLSTSRYLERIAEEVIFMDEGSVIRHQ